MRALLWPPWLCFTRCFLFSSILQKSFVKFWLSKERWGRGNSGDRSMERFPKPRKQILKQQWVSQNKKSSLMWSKRKILSLSFLRVFTELRQKSSIKDYLVTLDWEVDVFFFSYVSRKDCDIIRKLAASVLLPRLTEMRTTPETPRKQHQQEVGFMRTARNQPTVSELWTHACQSNTQVIPCDAWQQQAIRNRGKMAIESTAF